MDANIIWFSKGYVEYIIPNFIPASQKIEQIMISVELGSEAPGSNSTWPSDIHFYLNFYCIIFLLNKLVYNQYRHGYLDCSFQIQNQKW